MARQPFPVPLAFALLLVAGWAAAPSPARAEPADELAEIRTLRERGGHEATERLADLIASRSEAVRVAALEAVAAVGVRTREAAEAVRSARHGEASFAQQEAALQALGRIGGAQDVAGLIETLKGRDERMRVVAHGTLQTLTSRRTPLDYRRWYQWWSKEGRALQAGVRRALRQLPDVDGQERERLRAVLARDGWAEIAAAEDAAKAWLSTGDRTLRTQAFYLAAVLRLGDVVPEIESALPYLSSVEGADGLRAVRVLGLSPELLAPYWRRRLESGR